MDVLSADNSRMKRMRRPSHQATKPTQTKQLLKAERTSLKTWFQSNYREPV